MSDKGSRKVTSEDRENALREALKRPAKIKTNPSQRQYLRSVMQGTENRAG